MRCKAFINLKVLTNFIFQHCIKETDILIAENIKILNIKLLNKVLLQIYSIYKLKLKINDNINIIKNHLINFIAVNITDYKIILIIFKLIITDSVII